MDKICDWCEGTGDSQFTNQGERVSGSGCSRCHSTGIEPTAEPSGELSRVDVLSVDAWADGEGGWTWNSWLKIGTVGAGIVTGSTREILREMRDMGFLSDASKGRVSVDDDGYNLVIVKRGNRCPIFAIAYGARS